MRENDASRTEAKLRSAITAMRDALVTARDVAQQYESDDTDQDRAVAIGLIVQFLPALCAPRLMVLEQVVELLIEIEQPSEECGRLQWPLTN